jgi:putative peptidoglycan lipid II flippase
VRGSEFFELSNRLSALLFPFLGLCLLAAVASGVLYQRRKFLISSFSSSFLNFGYIIGATVFSSASVMLLPEAFDEIIDRRVLALSVGVLTGGTLHFLVQYFYISDEIKGVKRSWKDVLQSKDVRDVFFLMMPQALAASVASISVMINTNFATALETGSLTWLNYSFRLFQLPVGLFAVGVSVVMLPELSRKLARQSELGPTERRHLTNELSASFSNGLEILLVVMSVCSIYCYFNSQSLVSLFFFHGAFTESDVLQTSSTLAAYCFGFLGYGLIKVSTPYYFATNRTRVALWVTIVAVVANYFAADYLSKKMGTPGLALATSISLSINGGLLFLGVLVSGVWIRWKRVIGILAVFLAVVFLYRNISLLAIFDYTSAVGEDLFYGKAQAILTLTVELLFVSFLHLPLMLLRQKES